MIVEMPRRSTHSRRPTGPSSPAARLAGFLVVGCLVCAPVITAPTLGPTRAITVERLQTHLRVIASDELEGRDPLSPGFRAAADYVSGVKREIGATPLGDNGSYLQTVTMRRTTIQPEGTYVRIGSRTFHHGHNLLGSGSGSASGRVVYVGHGWRVPSKGIDPFAGVDVRDALLLVIPVVPAGVTFDELAQLEEDGGWFGPERNAKRFGARGVLRVGADGEVARAQRSIDRDASGGHLSVDRLDDLDHPLPTATLDGEALDALMDGERESAAALRTRLSTREPGASFALSSGKQVALTIATSVEREATFNVVAAIEGSDPASMHEYVALGAHLDHIGRRERGRTGGDDINNGADDDGSGVVALLEIAAAVARGPRPPRSLLFVWHTGEEAGGWGSRYFTAFPPVPLDRIVAQLNLDMVGRSRTGGDGDPKLSGPHELFVVGARRSSRDLSETIARVNREFLGLTLNTRYDASDDPERIYERSDHYQYAKKGIPVAFFFSGLHDDYHRPSDEIERIDFVKLQKVAQTVLAVAWNLASQPGRPGTND